MIRKPTRFYRSRERTAREPGCQGQGCVATEEVVYSGGRNGFRKRTPSMIRPCRVGRTTQWNSGTHPGKHPLPGLLRELRRIRYRQESDDHARLAEILGPLEKHYLPILVDPFNRLEHLDSFLDPQIVRSPERSDRGCVAASLPGAGSAMGEGSG